MRKREFQIRACARNKVGIYTDYAIVVARWTLDLFLTPATDDKALTKFIAEVFRRTLSAIEHKEGTSLSEVGLVHQKWSKNISKHVHRLYKITVQTYSILQDLIQFKIH